MTSLGGILSSLAPWLLTNGVRILIILIGATLVVRTANLAIGRLQRQLGRAQQGDLEWQRRASTLGRILTSLVTASVAAGQDVSGYPARPHRESLRASAALSRLVRLADELERMVQEWRRRG